ncbi:MAG: 30S ribosomal protein S5 [Candidatus Micrarchaeota archaeon]
MRRQKNYPRREETKKEWIPKTELGKKVKSGEITNFEDVYEKNLAVLEPEIIDTMLGEVADDVIKVKMVQRTTDSGRKGSFMVTAVVGDRNGHIGVGTGKGKEVRPAIEKAVRDAKKSIISVKRGCGSWQCGCGEEHSVPFKTRGSFSSVAIELIPAPKGTGVVAGKTAKKIIELAGIKDVWTQSTGNTKTSFNFAYATIDALRKTRKYKTK